VVADELAFLYLEHGGDVNLGLSLAQAAKQTLPDSPMTADALGWAYYKFGSPDLAVKELTEAARKAPNNPVYRYHLGMAYLATQRSDLGRQNLQAALQQDSNFLYAADARKALTNFGRQQTGVRRQEPGAAAVR
jgi:tetratricopeptide (TPR) repeat protein